MSNQIFLFNTANTKEIKIKKKLRILFSCARNVSLYLNNVIYEMYNYKIRFFIRLYKKNLRSQGEMKIEMY